MLKDVSLSTVKAFESAARHGSFRAAAIELNLSPSAISHAILKLEQSLGTTLFERDGRVVRLTPDGEALMRHVGLAFDELRRGMEMISNRGPQLLRLHSAPSFAAQWLSPRLSRFCVEQPGIEVRLAASTDYTRFTNDEFDADIVYGLPRVDGVIVVPLGLETVTPLCSPGIAARIRSIDDLLGEVLIQSDAKQVRWPAWFQANGRNAPPPHGMRFDRSFLAIAAACDSLGVALEIDAFGRAGDRNRSAASPPWRGRQGRRLHRPQPRLSQGDQAASSRTHLCGLDAKGARAPSARLKPQASPMNSAHLRLH